MTTGTPTTPTTHTTHTIDTSFVPGDIDCANWSQVEPLLNALIERDISTIEALEKWLLDRSEIEAALSEAGANRYIQMTCHTDDEEAEKAYLFFISEIDPKVKPLVFQLDQKFVKSPARAELDAARYGVLDRDTEVEVSLYRDENVLLETTLDQLDQKYQKICGAMMVEFDGKEQTMPQMGRYLEETDRTVREGAYRAMCERRYVDQEQIGGIYDEMITHRHQIALNAGFDNYRDYMFRKLHRFDYGPAECEQFHQACEEVIVPVLRQLNKERAASLGVETLRPWDLSVDVKGRAPLRPFAEVDEFVDGVERIFTRMDSSLGELFGRLRAPGCLDLDSRKGKAPGGYQYERDRKREAFIFMNSAGVQRDVDTLLHEGGHAFHSMLCGNEPLLHYRHAPIEFCEVASMSMELTAHPFLDEFYSPEEADRARRVHLEGMMQTLPWIATIDAFQHWIYLNPTHTAADREAYWLSLQDRFGAAVNWEGLEKYQATNWQRQLHLFGVPFYYIEYGIAQLGALQLWMNYRRDAAGAIADYKKGLSIGGAKPLPQLFEAAGLKFDFGPEIVKSLIGEVKKELKNLPA